MELGLKMKKNSMSFESNLRRVIKFNKYEPRQTDRQTVNISHAVLSLVSYSFFGFLSITRCFNP